MPFAYICGFIAGPVIRLGNGDGIRIQADIVKKYTVSKRISAGHQACTIGTAHRTTRYGIGEVYALAGKPVEIGLSEDSKDNEFFLLQRLKF